MKIYKFMKRYLKEQFKNLLTVLSFKIVLMILPLLFPICTKIIIDSGILKNDLHTTIKWAFIFLGIVFIRQIIAIFSWRVEARVNTEIVYSLRKKVSSVLLKQSISFFEKKEQGELITVLNEDTERIESFAIGTLYQIILNILTFIVATYLLFTLNYKMALITIGLVSIFPLFQRLFVEEFRETSIVERRSLSKITSLFQQMLSNIYIVLSYNLQKRMLSDLHKPSMDLIKARVKSETYGGIISMFIEVVLQVPLTVIVYGLGGYYVIKGQMQLGSLIAFSAYISYLLSPIGFFYRLKTSLVQVGASFDKISAVLESEPEVVEAPNSTLR